MINKRIRSLGLLGGLLVCVAAHGLSAQESPFQPKGKSPFQPKAKSPFTPVPSSPGDSDGEQTNKSETSASSRPSRGPTKFRHGKYVTMISPDDGWRYEPPQVPDLDFEPQQVDVPGLDFQDTIKQFDVNRAGTLGTMTVQRGFGNTQIKVMDFQQGTIVASVVTPKEVLVLDIDNHQQRLLLLSNRNSIGERFEVGTFLYGDSVLTEESVFAPFPDLNLSARNVTSANFVGEHELVAVSQSGRVSVWNLETLREECGFDLKAGANVVCGPDPDMIAFADDEKFGIFHVGRQEFLGVAQIPEGMKSPQIAISPSGTRLALAEGDQAVVVDTINGHVIETIPLAEKLLRDLEFATDEFLLVSHGALYSIADRMLLWDYTGADQAESLGNMTLFVSQGPSDKGSVIPATLPDAKAQAARDVAHAQPELFVVRPGDSVQIDVTNVPTQYRKTVQDALTEQVQDRDLTVVEESDVVLIATITGPEQKVYEYGGFGSINGGAGYVISEFVSTLEIRWKDQVAWSKQRTNAPGSVSAEQGKSYQDVLREKTKTPNLRVFEQAGFPTYVRKPSKGPAQSEQALGKSVINSLR